MPGSSPSAGLTSRPQAGLLPDAKSMKYSLIATAFLALIIPVRAGDAAPGDQVKAAVQKLADAPNYSWTVTVSSGDKSRFTPGPVEGRTEKGGCTHWKMNFGDRCAEAFTKGDRVAVKTDNGWVKPEDHRPSPPSSEASRPPDGKRHKDDRPRGSKTGFFARQLQSMKTPAALATELTGKITRFTADGGTVTGELSAEAARELLTFGHRRDNSRGGHGPPEPVNPRGSITFSLKDGQIQKLEVRLAATMNFNGSDLTMDRITVFEIKDVGTTRLEIPEQAKPLLEPALPGKKPA